ncbi:MAG TPA: hypothetical protein VK196_02945 [Magnetospirillum sp.]|nr:hypothetical protein [Magnetospirillum sp.]
MSKGFSRIALSVLLAALAPAVALAGHQTCGGKVVGNSVRTCPDGSLPMYQADTITPVAPASEQPRQKTERRATKQDAGALMGVWHTGVSGGVWQTPSAVPGYNTLHVSPGVRAGDLTIDPSGRYVWNSYGGKTGRWEPGDSEYPIVLIDTAEHRRWKVGPDQRHPGRIFIWDGVYTYVGSR